MAGEKITLDDVIAKLTEQSTVEDGIKVLLDAKSGVIANLKQQVNDLLSGVTLPAGMQEKIDSVFNLSSANTQKISDALISGTDEV